MCLISAIMCGSMWNAEFPCQKVILSSQLLFYFHCLALYCTLTVTNIHREKPDRSRYNSHIDDKTVSQIHSKYLQMNLAKRKELSRYRFFFRSKTPISLCPHVSLLVCLLLVACMLLRFCEQIT